MCGGQERCTQDFGGEFGRKRNHLENQGVDRRILLTWTFKKCDWGRDIDWMNLTQDRDKWRTLLNVEINLWVR